jgi:hypothetical protein
MQIAQDPMQSQGLPTWALKWLSQNIDTSTQYCKKHFKFQNAHNVNNTHVWEIFGTQLAKAEPIFFKGSACPKEYPHIKIICITNILKVSICRC